VALELKKDSKEVPTKLQLKKLELIENAQGIGLVVAPENWEDVYDFLKILSKENRYDRTTVERLNAS
jgi:hypothetical protein